jgi:hypothetical protein
MAQNCELLEKCGFFKKYGTSMELACKGFIQQYCQGTKQNECKRREYRQQHGAPPCDDMLPSGKTLSGS